MDKAFLLLNHISEGAVVFTILSGLVIKQSFNFASLWLMKDRCEHINQRKGIYIGIHKKEKESKLESEV